MWLPMKPRTSCKHLGCLELTYDKFCEKHKSLYKRKSIKERGYYSRWEAAKKRFLKLNPLCVKCLKSNRLVRATVVDYILYWFFRH